MGAMGVVFFCQSCGARFEVDPRTAGKKGRCKKCGQHMTIPRAEEIASMVAMPALAAAAVGGGAARPPLAPVAAAAAAGTGGSSIASWLKAGLSMATLAPLTVDRVPLRPSLPSALDDAEDSKPYVLAKPLVKNRGPVRIQDNVLVRLWRRELGWVQKVFRWLNESAYFVSIPFLMILLFGTVVKSRPLALFGATFVVLLNLGRFIAGAANLAVVPLRDGINVRKLKKPFRRVAEPALTIVLVFLGFTFIPWLSGGGSSKGSISARLRSEAETLKGDIKGEVQRVVEKAKGLDVDKLGAQASKQIDRLRTTPDDDAAAGDPKEGAAKSPDSAINKLIKDVGQRARETIDEAQKQP
jgi:hypothetical protein